MMNKYLKILISICLLLTFVFRSSAYYDSKYGDFFEAYKDLKVKSKNGDAKAQNDLGSLYEHGFGVKQDYKKALYWFNRSYKNGYIGAAINLAHFYKQGIDVEQNYQKAIYYYSKAMNAGYSNGTYGLALMYLNGKGVKKDTSKAQQLMIKAANRGNYSAQCSIANDYYDGINGLSQDYKKSLYWANKAADQGYIPAVQTLAAFYHDGGGNIIPVDLIQSYKWSYIASKSGNSIGDANIEDLKKHMSLKDIDRARSEAEEWLRTHRVLNTGLVGGAPSNVNAPQPIN